MKYKIVFIIIFFLISFFGFKQKDTKIIFVGDLNFDRKARELVSEKGGDFIFSCIHEYLNSADIVVGNLEGPITDRKSISVGTEPGTIQNYAFTFDPIILPLLKSNNIKLVNIGNNHILDFGEDGYQSTMKYLKKSGIDFIGGIYGDEPLKRLNLNGSKVSFISYNQFSGINKELVAKKIRSEHARGRVVVVYTHWGEEYGAISQDQRLAAELFATSGADIIIGSHPRIISEKDQMLDTKVYYSLGNFTFDQYWNPAVRTGLLIELNIIDGRLIPAERKLILDSQGRTCLDNAD